MSGNAATFANLQTTATDFPGFAPMAANFTPTPNAFFDKIVGHYPLCVVTVVAILIRETNGWTDSETGEKRAEAELPISKFIRPDFSKNSAREGLKKAIAAGFVVETASHTNRDGSRYALRWADDNALRTIIQRQRKAKDDTRPLSESLLSGGANSGVPNSGPPGNGRPNSVPPIDKENVDVKESVVYNVSKKPLNVTPDEIARLFGQTFNAEERDLYTQLVLVPVRELTSLTKDFRSRMRFIQLREICLKNDATGAWSAAFISLEKRLQLKANPLGKPGAYFNTVCMKQLENRGIVVPRKSEEPDRAEVRDLIAASLSGEAEEVKPTDSATTDGESNPGDDSSIPPESTESDANVWSAVLETIRASTNPSVFHTHFRQLRLVSLSDTTATVVAPSENTFELIQTTHKTVLGSAFKVATGRKINIQLVRGEKDL